MATTLIATDELAHTTSYLTLGTPWNAGFTSVINVPRYPRSTYFSAVKFPIKHVTRLSLFSSPRLPTETPA